MSDWQIMSDKRLMEIMNERASQIERPLYLINEIEWSISSSSKSYLYEVIPHQREDLEVYLNYEI